MTTPGSPEPDRVDGTGDAPRAAGYTGGVTDGNLSQAVDLRDFLNGVGTVLQLDRRRKGPMPKAQPAEAPDVGAGARRRRLIPAAALITALTAAAIRFWPGAESTELPVGIRGLWTTSDQRYGGRAFLIAEREVTFQTPGHATVHSVTAVHERQAGDTTYLTIDYLLDGKPVPWKLRLDSGPEPAIHLVNQPDMEWRPAGHTR